jgi:hypothetical protein
MEEEDDVKPVPPSISTTAHDGDVGNGDTAVKREDNALVVVKLEGDEY